MKVKVIALCQKMTIPHSYPNLKINTLSTL